MPARLVFGGGAELTVQESLEDVLLRAHNGLGDRGGHSAGGVQLPRGFFIVTANDGGQQRYVNASQVAYVFEA